VFEREMAYLLNRWKCAVRMRDLTAVVLEAREQAKEQPAQEAGRSDGGEKHESEKL